MINKALIIAAGRGSRLGKQTDTRPKPLVEIFGIPLLERIIKTSAMGGITEFYIVAGYKKEMLMASFEEKKLPFKIIWIENEEWEKSNGVSVLKGAEYLKNDHFLLMMSDHIFEAKTVQQLIKTEHLLEKADSILASDSMYTQKEGMDLDDATKILVKDGYIIDIGKEIKNFNAIDTGLFLCGPGLFDELEKIYKEKGDVSLTEGNKALVAKQRFLSFDIGDNTWQDIDTIEDLKIARKKILNLCRKDTDGIVSRNFNRYISLLFTRLTCKTPLTPNQISFIVLLVGLLSAWFIMSPDYLVYLAGLVLYKLTSILDGWDGEMAKIKFQSSKLGEWIDTACDNITQLFFFSAIGYQAVQHSPDLATLMLAWIAPGAFLFAIAVMLVSLTRHHDSGSLVTLNTRFNKNNFRKVLGSIIRRDVYTVIFLVLGIFQLYTTILILSLVATISIIVYMSAPLIKNKKKATLSIMYSFFTGKEVNQ